MQEQCHAKSMQIKNNLCSDIYICMSAYLHVKDNDYFAKGAFIDSNWAKILQNKLSRNSCHANLNGTSNGFSKILCLAKRFDKSFVIVHTSQMPKKNEDMPWAQFGAFKVMISLNFHSHLYLIRILVKWCLKVGWP